MSNAAYDPSSALQVHVVAQSPHTFAYRLWCARPGAAVWDALDTGTITTPEREYGPFPADTEFAYTLLVGGDPSTAWRTRVMLSQRGVLLDCSPVPETGITGSEGVSRRDTVLALR